MTVGGTSGIGESTAREFVRNTISPRIYLVGRNASQASRIQSELQTLNPSSQVKFVQSDITLLKNVDAACAEIQDSEKQVNLLFMTAGFLTLAGRTETAEGLDRKLNMNYYSRFRFVHNLLPQLTAAAQSGSLSRSVSVLAAGKESPDVILDDLSLKTHYSAGNALKHATTMNSLMASHLAALNPGTAFVHMSPGMVKTNMLQNMGVPSWINTLAAFLLTPFCVPIKESGERHLYAATSSAFAPKGNGGRGSYLLDWGDGEVGNERVLKRLGEEGVAEKVWGHTREVYERVCGEGKRWEG